jgi:SRSO17 transposase
LYLPHAWFKPEYRERWQRCGIPDTVTFHTRPELGAEMLRTIGARAVLPFQWVAMDEGFGKSPHLLTQIAAENHWFFAEIPRITRAWKKRPPIILPTPGPPGRPPTKVHLAPNAPPARRVDVLAAAWPRSAWHSFIIHEGSKGPVQVEIAAVRVVMAEDDLPGRDEWRVVRRSHAKQPPADWKFYRSNAPAEVSLKTLARMTAWRWPVETVIEECKGELGLDQYEVRSWRGWHQHTTLTLLSHHFLVRLRVQLGQDAPALTVSQVRRLLQVTLPRREFDAQAALDELARLQRQNYAAYRSHRKRTRHQIQHQSSPPK